MKKFLIIIYFILISVFLFSFDFGNKNINNKEIEQWEYKEYVLKNRTYYMELDKEEEKKMHHLDYFYNPTDKLNEFGKEGWEIVTVYTLSDREYFLSNRPTEYFTSYIVYVLKRKINEVK